MKTRTVYNGGMSIVLDIVKGTDRRIDRTRGRPPDFPCNWLRAASRGQPSNRTAFLLDRLVSCTIDTSMVVYLGAPSATKAVPLAAGAGSAS